MYDSAGNERERNFGDLGSLLARIIPKEAMSSSLWLSRHDYFNCTQYHEKRQHQTRGVVKDAYASSFGQPYLPSRQAQLI